MSDGPQSLPDRPNLEHLKKQAKQLLAAARRGDANALQQLTQVARSAATAEDATLASAQRAIANQYGFDSWPMLKDEVERRALLRDPTKYSP